MKLEIDHTSKIPLHAQTESILRQLIEQPAYKNGGLLPKEVDLAKELGISRNTLRQAMNKLEYEGLLIRKKGVGTKVAENGITTNLDNWLSFTQEMSDQGIEFKNDSVMARWVDANEKIAAFFHIPKGHEVLCVSRLKGVQDCPFVYFESYFHPQIKLSIKEDFNRPLYDILERDYHVVPSFSKENIKARAATKIISDKLKINMGEPILVRERYVSDADKKPIEYNIGFYIAEKFTYSITIKR